MSGNKRLAIVASHPVQYYAPWFRQLAVQDGIVLRVFYLWNFGINEQVDAGFEHVLKWDIDLLGGYDFEWVPNRARNPGTSRFGGLHNPDLRATLRKWRPDHVLIYGYGWRSMAELALFWRDCPLLLRGDNHLLGRAGVGLGAIREWLRFHFLRWLLSRYTAFACVGAANRAFYARHGVAAKRLFHVPHCVDNDRFGAVSVDRAAAWRQANEIAPDQMVFLFAGKFESKKRPDLLLEAFRQAHLPGATLVLLGEGPLKPALLHEARHDSGTRILPFHNQSEMPVVLTAADCLVLPSQGPGETWGLIVNEAMASGTPAIVSDHVGCAMDLIDDGRTGWIFTAGDVGELREKLRIARAEFPAARAAQREAARAHIRRYSYEAATAALMQMLAAIDADRPNTDLEPARP